MKGIVAPTPGKNPASTLKFRRLTFVPAQRADAHSIKPDVDLHRLNAEMPSVLAAQDPRPEGDKKLLADKAFCQERHIQLQWCSPRKAGSGLINLGNTCFMNSVLQCLTHTPPLAELCLQQRSLSSDPNGNQQLDPIVATQTHIRRALTTHTALQPKWHARNLKAINRRFRLGRQEDAHEYLRCVLDAMHEAFLKPLKPKPPPELAVTTFVHRIFGGKLRSQIICEGVDYTSSTFDPFLDLSLEINKANSLSRALQHFTAAEVLDGDNMYRCPVNNKLVRAYKRISIDDAPNVLTIHLKRFDFFGRGHKLSKKVEFGLELDLGPYMTPHHNKHHHHHHKHHQDKKQHTHQHQQQPQHSQQPGGSTSGQYWHHARAAQKPVLYDLYAVLVHHGHSLHSGHYVCYVKAGNGIWHLCDDHRVAQVSQRAVEGQQAYILFYIKRKPRSASAGQLADAATLAARAAAVAANQQEQQHQQKELLPGSDSTPTSFAAVAAAAVLQSGRMQAAAAAGRDAGALGAVEPHQQGPAAAGGGQSVNVSAVDGARKVVTSSTESTANASAGAKEPLFAGAVDSAPASRLNSLHHGHHSHHHFTRSRLVPWFDRHRQLHRETSLQQQRLQQLQKQHKLKHQAAVGGALNGLATVHAEHSGVPAATMAGKNASVVEALPHSDASKQASSLTGSKRSRAVQAVQQQQQQPQPGLKLSKSPSKQQQASDQQQEDDAQQVVLQADDAQPMQPPGEAGVQQQQQHHRKRHKLVEVADQQVLDPEQPAQLQQPASSAAGKSVAQQQKRQQSGQPQHQPVLQSSTTVVMGAAAFDILMRPDAAAGPGSWEGADTAVAAQAAALRRTGSQKKQQRDEWDVEYDRGRLKKVRQRKGEEEENEELAAGGNRFQAAWDEGLPQQARSEAWKGQGQPRGFGSGSNRGRGNRGGSRGRGGGGSRGRNGGRGRGGFAGRFSSRHMGGRAGHRGRGGGRGAMGGHK